MVRKVVGQGVDDFTAASRRAYAKMSRERRTELDALVVTASKRLKERRVKGMGDQLIRDLVAKVGAYLVKEGIP